MRKIVFICGESGAGKSYLQEKLLNAHPSYYTRIISTTTRKPREGEENGVHYWFKTEEEFKELKSKGRMLQSVNFGGNNYGTQMSEYEQTKPVGLFVCTPEGIRDTIDTLAERDIDFEYRIIMFMTSNDLLVKHGISEDRIDRGGNRINFIKRYINNEYLGYPMYWVDDNMVKDNLSRKVDSWILEN